MFVIVVFFGFAVLGLVVISIVVAIVFVCWLLCLVCFLVVI